MSPQLRLLAGEVIEEFAAVNGSALVRYARLWNKWDKWANIQHHCLNWTCTTNKLNRLLFRSSLQTQNHLFNMWRTNLFNVGWVGDAMEWWSLGSPAHTHHRQPHLHLWSSRQRQVTNIQWAVISVAVSAAIYASECPNFHCRIPSFAGVMNSICLSGKAK